MLARTMLIDVLNVVASVVLPSNVIVITSSPEASGIRERVRARWCCRRQLRPISTRQSKQPQDTCDGSERRRLSDVARRRPGSHDRGAAPGPSSRSTRTAPSSLAPAISDGGTNLLACRPPHAIRPEFGAGSFAKHLAAAERSGLACHVLNSPELGLGTSTARKTL